MTISLFTDGLHPLIIGGMQKHSTALAKYLSREGVQVDLYTIKTSEFEIKVQELFTDDERKNLNIIAHPFPESDNLPGHYIRASKKFSELLLKEYLSRPKTDLLYFKGFTGLAFFEEKRLHKFPPMILNMHGYEMFQKPADFKSFVLSKLILRSPAKYSIKNADRVISYGGRVTDVLLSAGCEKEKIIAIPSGIDESWINLNEITVKDKRKFIFVGRYERRKGIEELHAVLNKISESNFEFHFVGPIPENKRLRKDNIFYHGSITDSSRLKSLLHEMDILVCPSHSEGMPNVILEGMASGLAIIATDVGAVQTMVDNKNGILISPANEHQLDQAIKKMISLDERNLVEIKYTSLEKIKSTFLWSRVINITIEKFQNVISSSKST